MMTVKMCLNFVVLLALAGAVRTSVIVNVYEDGEVKASHSLRSDCNNRACDQLCRRLGFPGGVCVADKCKCDINFSPSTEKKADDSVDKTCNSDACNQMCRALKFATGVCVGDICKCMGHQKSSTGNTLDSLLRSTREIKVPQALDADNKGSEFLVGVNDSDEDEIEDNNDIINLKDKPAEARIAPRYCNNSACLSSCHRLGYIGGSCWLGVCQCY